MHRGDPSNSFKRRRPTEAELADGISELRTTGLLASTANRLLATDDHAQFYNDHWHPDFDAWQGFVFLARIDQIGREARAS